MDVGDGEQIHLKEGPLDGIGSEIDPVANIYREADPVFWGWHEYRATLDRTLDGKRVFRYTRTLECPGSTAR